MHLSPKRHEVPTISQVFLVVDTGITAKNNTKSLPYIINGRTIFFQQKYCPVQNVHFESRRVKELDLLLHMKQLKKENRTKQQQQKNQAKSMKEQHNTSDSRNYTMVIRDELQKKRSPSLQPGEKDPGHSTAMGIPDRAQGSSNRVEGQLESVGQSQKEEKHQKEKPRDLHGVPHGCPYQDRYHAIFPKNCLLPLTLTPDNFPSLPEETTAQSSAMNQFHLSQKFTEMESDNRPFAGRGSAFFCSTQCLLHIRRVRTSHPQ